MKRRDVPATMCAIPVLLLLSAADFPGHALAAAPIERADKALFSPAELAPAPGDYDGDGATDIALKGIDGVWFLDYAANGFGSFWDAVFTGYGFSTALPVPADYDDDDVTDIAVKDGAGMWGVDYAVGTFGLWNLQLFGYGNSASVPVPADYDGDGKADLSVKTSAGDWLLNYSADGFANGWDIGYSGYGDALAIPVPADYDGDQYADLAVKDAGGCWFIDYAANGFAGWNEIRCGYGDATAVPVPFDYDNDTRADLSVKGDDGNWYIDSASNGFGAWDVIYSGRGGNWAIAVPGDYDGDDLTDLSVYSTVGGEWYIDYAANGFSYWDASIANAPRTVVDTTRPYISSISIWGEGNVLVSQLTVGVRYTVDVIVQRGSGANNAAGVEINEILNVPAALQIVNRFGSTFVSDVSSEGTVSETHRRFALTPTEPGNFPLGFQLRESPPYYGGSVFHHNYGIRVNVVSPPQTAISGRVTQKLQNAQGVFVSGPPIEGAVVTLVSSGGIQTTTDSDGKWRFPVAGTTAPMAVRITKPGYSEMNVVNLRVPISGLLVNTQMEQAFPALPGGIQYKSYIDYSGSRALLHVVEVTPGAAGVRLGKAGFDPAGECHPTCAPLTQCPNFATLEDVGESLNAVVIMNGTWWNICNANPVGYVYAAQSSLQPEVWCDNRFSSTTDCSNSNLYYAEGLGTTPLYPAGTTPMFTIQGLSGVQEFDIVQSEANFLDAASTQWSQVGFPSHAIWDVSPRDGLSDITYAIQIPNPPLLRDGNVIASGHFQSDSYGNYDYAFARTSVGVGADGKLFMVIVDGEGVHGNNGMTANQLAHFYRDVLNAELAMGLDSGLSSELRVRTSGGLHRVNTMSGEDATIQLNPYTEVLQDNQGAVGSVGYYIAVTNDATPAPQAESSLRFALDVRSGIGSSNFQFALTLPEAAVADLRLYDVRGRQVAVAFRGELKAGGHLLTWRGADGDGAAVASGVYYYRFTAGTHRAAGSVVVVR